MNQCINYIIYKVYVQRVMLKQNNLDKIKSIYI